PAPKAITGSDSTGAPGPVATSSERSSSQGTDNGPPGPAPRRSSSNSQNGSDGTPLAVKPRLVGEGGPGIKSPIKGTGTLPSVKDPQPVDFSAYMADLQRRIRKHWFPPHAPTSRVAIVVFSVSSDGTLSNVRLSQSTGEKRSDDAALQAVQEASPFH